MSNPPIKIYDLAGADPARRFSPYCWRTHMALKHKHLEFETIPWRFSDKEVIAFSGQGLVPVMIDGETTVADSWAIAEYLEEAYPGKPSLFDGAAGKREARFLKHWTETILNGMVSRMIIKDIYDRIDVKDQPYFRESREKRFGKPLEEVIVDREAVRVEFGKALAPMRNVLKEQPFLCGEAPSYGDYVVFGTFAWARNTSPFDLVPGDAPIEQWRERMLGLFDGYAASFPSA